MKKTKDIYICCKIKIWIKEKMKEYIIGMFIENRDRNVYRK